MTISEQDRLLIEEATKRAEASRPRILLKVETKEVDPLLVKAQEEVDNTTLLIPESIRETFRIELGNILRVIKKREQPHTLIIPKDEPISPSIKKGIINYYTDVKGYSPAQVGTLMDILNNIETNTDNLVSNKKDSKSKRVKSDKPKREPKPRIEDKDKITVTNTPGLKIIKLSDICTEIGLDSKKARMKLRKQYNKPTNGWEWSEDQVDDIKKFLRG